MELTPREHALLTLLQNNPTITYAQIARYFNVSAPTGKKLVEKLRERGLYSGKYAQYDPHALGLERYIILFTISSVKNYSQLERILDAHPYTKYRARIYGSQLGLQATFDYPSQDPKYLIELFKILKEEKIIETYRLFKSTGIRKALHLDLKRISLHSMNWEYDWSIFQRLSREHVEGKDVFPKRRNCVIEQMKELDFKILRILSYNADISQRELARKYMAEPTEIWRRVHFLEDHVLTGYRAKINRMFFNVTSSKLLFLSFENENLLTSTFAALCNEDTRPPFRYTIEIVEDEAKKKYLMLFVSLPHYHEANMCYALNNLGCVEMLNLDTTGRNSVTYAFYEKNYDLSEHKWRLEKDYIIKEPIKALKSN